VLFKAGVFTKLMDMQSATRDDTILAYSYKGKMLEYEHGAPLRLIFPSQQCYESVKWVNEIEVLEQPTKDTGRDIALSRIQTKRLSKS
jgi:DMSO/TMAO reductase YedYZ molybdopterin-dependent catalytic subunit